MIKHAVALLAFLLLLSETSANPIAGNALVYDGVDDLVRVADSPSLDATSAVTLELWIQPASAVTGRRLRIINKSDNLNVTSQRSFELSIGVSSRNFLGEGVTPDYFTGTPEGWTSFDTPWVFQPGEWIHIATTYDASNGVARTFINGTLLGSTTVTALPAPIEQNLLVTSLPLILGLSNLGGGAFDGLMDEVRIWNIARSPTEIASNYNQLIDPSSPGLVAYYNFDEALTDQNVLDASSFGNHGSLGNSLTPSADDPSRIASTAPFVPEPSSLLLLTLGSLKLLRCRRWNRRG